MRTVVMGGPEREERMVILELRSLLQRDKLECIRGLWKFDLPFLSSDVHVGA